MKFSENHYIPCLRWKQGEYMAVESLSSVARQNITPLIEVPEIGFDFETWTDKKTLDEHIAPFAKRVVGKWGRAPCLIDLINIPPDVSLTNGTKPLEYVFEELRTQKCQAIPVTGLNRDPKYQSGAKKIAKIDKMGVSIRLTLPEVLDSKIQRKLDILLQLLEMKAPDCDMIIDLGSPNFNPIDGLSKLVSAAFARLPYLDKWRNVVLIGTSFPDSMAEVKIGPTIISRSEWLLYKRLVALLKGRNLRIPTFGDYCINHKDITQIDMRLVKPSATIRYTIKDSWCIVKGKNVRNNGFDQYRKLCNIVMKLPYFKSAPRSMGNNYISDCAKGHAKTGNLSTWRKVGTNHHMEVVVRELASFFAS